MDHAKYTSLRLFPILKRDEGSNTFFDFDSNFHETQRSVDAALIKPGQESPGCTFNPRCKSFLYDLIQQDCPIINYEITDRTESVTNLIYGALNIHNRKWMSKFLDGDAAWKRVSDGNTGRKKVVQWSEDKSTPVNDVGLVIDSIHLYTQMYRPNKLLLGRQVYLALRQNPDLLKYANKRSVINENFLAQFLEVDEVMVANPIISGNQNVGLVGGKNALLAYVSDSVSMSSPSVGYTMVKSGIDQNPDSITISDECQSILESYGMSVKYVTYNGLQHIRLEWHVFSSVVSEDLGHFFKDIVS